jgi:uncharacterized OB-fold protein
MTDEPAALTLGRCDACNARFLPTDGPCPRCASVRTQPYSVPGLGTVLAATELANPPPRWPNPHRLALVEVADGVRILGIVDSPLPAAGDVVSVRRDGEVYRLRGEPTPS